MSIKVTIRRLTAWRNDLPDQIRAEKVNEVAEDYAAEIESELGHMQCKIHPAAISHITVVADRTGALRIEKKFCCIEFEKKVSPKIER
jgi:hypothetical protein